MANEPVYDIANDFVLGAMQVFCPWCLSLHTSGKHDDGVERGPILHTDYIETMQIVDRSPE